ncbi:tetratricopeptide repeat-containing diguanylate cyclase [Thiolapillus brandeum]|uniref:diguanylate cyclase n=1 Tax=Thiolapillus brandeum TaxID=1076588 RepID=A0A7U6GL45_9GAMM|nr:GGDEF domain-containing protein [Thiolapillus brandeum]BAO45646.1 hypothetical protein TBH_C2744 [Thiolapillus brandeum]
MLTVGRFLLCLMLLMPAATPGLAGGQPSENPDKLELAQRYLDQGQALKALEISDNVLKTPGLTVAQQARAMAYYLQAMKELDRRNLEPSRKQQALVLADTAADQTQRMKIWWNLGVVTYNQGELAEAQHYFERALENRPPEDFQSQYKLLMSIGATQIQLGDYADATESMLKAEKIHESAGLPPDNALYQNLSGLFYYLKDWDKTIEYGQKALAITDKDSVEYTWILSDLGLDYRHKNDYKNAYRYLKATLDRAPDDAHNWLNLGYVLLEEARYAEALDTLNKALELYKKQGTPKDLGVVQQYLGRAWSGLGDSRKAMDHFHQALAKYDQQDNPPERLRLYEHLAVELEKNGRYAEALAIMKKHQALHDELFNADTQARIARIRSVAELEKKKRTLTALEQERKLDRQTIERLELQATHERTVRSFLLGGLLLTGFTLVLLIGVARLRKRLHQELARQHQDIATLNRKLQETSVRDPLTGLYNRRYLTEYIDTFAANQRNLPEDEKNPQALVILADLDRFKDINDTWGHSAGDLALKEFARVFSTCARKDDIPVRWGGEEFLLFCKDMDNHQGAALCTRIQQKLHALAIAVGDRDLHITCSFGIAPFPIHPALPLRWSWTIMLADAALYAAKAAGRDRWVAYALRDIPSWLDEDRLDIPRLLSSGHIEVTESDTRSGDEQQNLIQ